jgi:squalene-hopene/tetraprenyl-beta-curcumene cyclase
MTPGLQVEDSLAASVAQALRRATDQLLSRQHGDGYWWGDLTADTTLESDWLLLLLWLHPPRDGVWSPPNPGQVDRAVASILARQLPAGGFPVYPQGPAEVSASIKAYFALKLAGLAPGVPEMTRLRDTILSLGGLQAANSYVKLNLALFGLYPREHVPSVPPEMILLPKFIYEMSSWTRAIVLPLSVLHAEVIARGRPRPVPAGFTLDELMHPTRPHGFAGDPSFRGWRNLFVRLDRLIKKWYEPRAGSLRRKAIARIEQWMLDHFRHSGGLAAIYPSMQYAVMALDVLGYPPEHPVRAASQREFDCLLVDRDGQFFFQPCFSPVWDTAIAAFALGESGAAPPASLRRAGQWLLGKEVRRKGDWSVKRPRTEPSGWYFEFANEFYPDIDDTAMVLLSLAHARPASESDLRAVVGRAVNWLLAMQSSDGGWAAFDVDNDWEFLSHVPFADHNAMLDPTCPDITGRVLEALCRWGTAPDSAPVRRGVQYLLHAQLPDGSWHGRWGVNHIYGTCFALRGLRAAGFDDHEAPVLRAGEWLRSIQNPDGGWGESCRSYDERTYVPAPSTPSQTAWALLGLLAAGDSSSESVLRGVKFLVHTMTSAGTWTEDLATGTGFPRVFYLCYHLYRQSFPVLALAEFLKSRVSYRGENG